MWWNNSRHLSFRSQRNFVAIVVFIFVLITFYLMIYSMNGSDLMLSPEPVTIYLCPQLASSSQGYLRVEFSRNFSVDYSQICRSTDILLVYILSTVGNFDRRRAIRHTWAQRDEYPQLNDTCFIFLIGLLNESPVSKLHIDLEHESQTHGDLVQINLTETYQNVVYKEIGALKWSHLYASHIPFLFKTDDDLIVDTLLLGDIARFLIDNETHHSLYLQKQSVLQPLVRLLYATNKKTLFKGNDYGGQKTSRRGKFGVHELAWNHDQLPGYCSGFGFMFSSFVRDRLYRASLCYATEYVAWVGDLFVSGFLAGTASVRCSSWPIGHAQVKGNCSPIFEQQPAMLICSTPMHLGRYYLPEYHEAWKVILARHADDNQQMKTRKSPNCSCLLTNHPKS